ncbi:hypothetical protein NE237_000841 [Protea cynaroides]|uniref:SKP1-like protein n=1 Tax=Protea cynaroides TaxID=273540 RepID=A0A9Q0QXV8_9MAGN|nr:hypothetical protein NE237_000841 [Protea cynaroides]
MIDDGCSNGVIPLPNVCSKILIKVIEYCKKHVEDNEHSKKTGVEKGKDYDEKECEREKVKVEERKRWQVKYMDIDQQVLYHLMIAANFLEIKGLLELTVEKAASMIRGKTPNQIREIFNIKNDFTPEAEEEIRKGNDKAINTNNDSTSEEEDQSLFRSTEQGSTGTDPLLDSVQLNSEGKELKFLLTFNG